MDSAGQRTERLAVPAEEDLTEGQEEQEQQTKEMPVETRTLQVEWEAILRAEVVEEARVVTMEGTEVTVEFIPYQVQRSHTAVAVAAVHIVRGMPAMVGQAVVEQVEKEQMGHQEQRILAAEVAAAGRRQILEARVVQV